MTQGMSENRDDLALLGEVLVQLRLAICRNRRKCRPNG